MLRETIALWAGGPSVTLGNYLVGLKYGFSILFLCWACGLLRWSHRWLLGGSIALAALAWVALDRPLGRPYGVFEDGRGIYELAQPMVVAARGDGAEGWMVHQPNPRPLWSLMLALASGLDADRLLRLYRWVPLSALLFLSLSLYVALKGLGGDGGPTEHLARALAVFFVVFLSANRLSFVRGPGPFWPRVFWLEPSLAYALGLAVVDVRLLSKARRWGGYLLAGAGLALTTGLEPSIGVVVSLSACVWLFLGRARPQSPGLVLVTLAAGWVAFFLWPADLAGSRLPEAAGSWPFAVESILSLSLDLGLVLYLAVFELVCLIRRRSPHGTLFVSAAFSGWVLWILACCIPGVGSRLDVYALAAYVRLLVAALAGRGACEVVLWLTDRLAERGGQLPRVIAAVPARRLTVAGLVALALPWCFPYWWHPVRMDPTYVKSIPPISRQFLTLGEWIRTHTPPDAVFAAGPSYAHWIAALGGRRVLLVEQPPRAPEDAAARQRAQAAVAVPHSTGAARRVVLEWDLTHFAWGRLDQEEAAPVDFDVLESSPLYFPVWRQRRWVRVYELRP